MYLSRHASGAMAACVLLAAPALAQSTAARIDQEIQKQLNGHPVAVPASDAEFLRRVFLDLTGVIPSAAETRAFLADTAPDKRARLIDQLLASDRFARHLAVQLDVLFLDRRAD